MEKIKIKCKGADLLSIDTIMDFQGKLKRITKDNLERLKVSILKNGFVAPIFIWRNDDRCMALDGHQRVRALLSMRQEGYDIPLLPVAYIEADDEKDARQKLLAITSQYGEFDIDELNLWVNDLDDEIAETLRFAGDKIELDLEDETEDDDGVPEKVDAVTQLGDMWELGRHRVLCGDAKIHYGIYKDIDCIITDPPYGIDLDTDFSTIKNELKFARAQGVKAGKKYKKIINDDEPFDPQYLIDNFEIETFLFGADNYCNNLPNNGSWMVWDKRSNDDTDESIIKSRDKIIGSAFEMIWSRRKHKKIIIRVMWAGIFGTEKENKHKRYHPTQKPIRLYDRLINDYTKQNMVIGDFYLGSGSTLITCEKNNRICYGIELDPYYCDVIINRYRDWCIKNEKEYTIKLNGEPWQ